MKRFTETLKWEDPEFRSLPPKVKLLLQWLEDHCDIAGVIRPDLELASFQIGEPINQEDIIKLGKRLRILDGGKLQIVAFVQFQFGTLSDKSIVHKSVMRVLESHELLFNPSPMVAQGLAKGLEQSLGRGLQTPKEKEKDKEKEKVQEKVQEKDKVLEGGTGGNHRFEKPTLGMVQLHAAKIGLPEIEAEKFFHYHETDGWRAKNGPMRSWVSAMATWKLNYYAWNQSNRGSGGNRPRLTVAEERNSHIIGAAETLEQIRERSKANETAEPPF